MAVLSYIKSFIQGDLFIWALVALLALFSFMPVYSASTNLVYVVGDGTKTTLSIIIKHVVLLCMGFGLMFFVHRLPYRYFSGLSVVLIPIVIVLLLVTQIQGLNSESATNTARWFEVPGIGLKFQPSTLASLVVMVYTARYLAQRKDVKIEFKESLLRLWIPIALVLMFILPANFSTTAILFSMVLLLCFIGGYPIKYILGIIGTGVLILTLFVLVGKAFPEAMPNRIDTWLSRIESFSDEKEEGYQVENAKIAIATGGLTGKGPGKSVQKNFLPQSSSDFIFAIIVEEYGLIGACMVLLVYLLLTFRMYVAVKKAGTIFAKLLVIGVGFPIVFQAIINMMVATNLGPVTGQPLPLISSGGTSNWMICLAVGMVLSVTASNDVTEEELEEKGEDPLENLYHNHEETEVEI